MRKYMVDALKINIQISILCASGFILSPCVNCICRSVQAYTVYSAHTIYIQYLHIVGEGEYEDIKGGRLGRGGDCRCSMYSMCKHMNIHNHERTNTPHTWTSLSQPFSWPSIFTDTLLSMIALVGYIYIEIGSLFIYTNALARADTRTHLPRTVLFFKVSHSYLSCFEGKIHL